VLIEGGGGTGAIKTEARLLLVRVGQPDVLQELWQNSCRTLARLHFDRAASDPPA
jgi:hypothetical protein